LVGNVLTVSAQFSPAILFFFCFCDVWMIHSFFMATPAVFWTPFCVFFYSRVLAAPGCVDTFLTPFFCFLRTGPTPDHFTILVVRSFPKYCFRVVCSCGSTIFPFDGGFAIPPSSWFFTFFLAKLHLFCVHFRACLRSLAPTAPFWRVSGSPHFVFVGSPYHVRPFSPLA